MRLLFALILNEYHISIRERVSPIIYKTNQIMEWINPICWKRLMSMFYSICFILCLSLQSSYAVVYTVNGLGDAGAGAATTGDLRYCITQANLLVGPHTINFTAAGTINLTATLPVFTRQILVQGNTAPGYALATPTVQLNGNGVAQWVFLLNDAGGANSLIQGLVINRATLTNIEVNAVNGVTIRDCFVGTNMAGAASAGVNPNFGIQLITADNCTILNNIISGHANHGLLLNVGSDNNTIRGNKIGCNLLGTAAIPNAFHGIEINNTSINNVVGGAAAVDRNIISGNTHIGISVVGTSSGTQITNNYIGTNLAGTAALSNVEHGIMVDNSASAVITNNVVSGNLYFGLHIINATGHIFRGNKVGTNAAGTAAIPNTFVGLRIESSGSPIIGGATAGQGNTLSGNGEEGLFIITSATANIKGNYIGTNATGAGAIANGRSGIHLTGCGTATIGGAATGEPNTISGNTWDGIQMDNSPNAIIKGNFIGTNVTGTAAIANASTGIHTQTCATITIGGILAGEDNTISGNGSDGIRFEGTTNATVQGNFIGTNATGTGAIGNGENGIAGYTGSNNNLIGGTVAAARNIISGNNVDGIHYDGFTTACNDLLIKNNYIGTNAAGTGAAATFGNGQGGIVVTNNCLRLIIGGTTAAERNIISGNGRLWGGAGNGTGVFIYSCVSAQVIGNYIGLAADGTTAMGNAENGIVIYRSDNVTIGGNSAILRNLISSNGRQGIVLNTDYPLQIAGTIIIGNYIGTDVSGTLARGNGQSGIIALWSNNAFFGRANAGEGNIISNNAEEGIHFIGGNGNTVYNNLIGVAANGTTAMGNKIGGIFIQGVGGGTYGSNNTVGGLAALQANTIAYSSNTGANPDLGNGFGIGVAHNDQGIQNRFIGNKVFCNVGLGIDLDFAGAFGGTNNGVGNGGKSSPALTSVAPTVTSGTGVAGETIHVYNNVTCVSCQGEVYLGSTVVTGGGTWSLTHVSVATPANNSATATSAALGTSQFSCYITLPVELIYFNAKAQGSAALLSWSTAWEKDNKGFFLERSADGIQFETIGSVKGNGSTTNISTYQYIDEQPLDGISYYRLKQLDINGAFTYSEIRSVSFYGNQTVQIFPNPAKDFLTVNFDLDEKCEIRIYKVLGVEIQNVRIEKNYSTYTIDLANLASGSYIVELNSASVKTTKQFLKY